MAPSLAMARLLGKEALLKDVMKFTCRGGVGWEEEVGGLRTVWSVGGEVWEVGGVSNGRLMPFASVLLHS
jgi:hypothetical protein